MEQKTTVEKWKMLIAEQQNSGLSIEAWCQKNQIDKSRYYYWKRKFRSQEQAETEIQFAELPLSSEVASIQRPERISSSGTIQIRYRGFEIDIPETATSARILTVLDAVLSALKKRC